MAKLPLEDKANGIHRAKLWEIGMYALNNTSSNCYAWLVASISYFLVGIVGVAAVLAGTIITMTRIWDGISDPIIGLVVDKTNGKFGKNRPFIVIGQIILFITTFIIFRLIPVIPANSRLIVFLILYIIYIIGYTCQCIVTKSAQTCMTNDPKQRPVFGMFDTTYNTILMSLFCPIYLTTHLVPKFTLTSEFAADKIASIVAQNPAVKNTLTVKDGVTTLSAFYNPEMWQYWQLTFGALSAVLAVCAIIAIWRKDRPEYFGTGKVVKVGLRDYWDVLKNNRAIQMLIVAAGTDKLATLAVSNTTVMVCLFGIICGNYSMYSSYSAITAIPTVLIAVLCINFIARRLGQKKALLYGSLGAIVFALLLGAWIIFGNPSAFSLPMFSLTKPATWAGLFDASSWSLFGVVFVILYILMQSSSKLSGAVIIPMTADCADYEVYRSGKYVPGLMGTLFSFVDKLLSSLSTTIVAIAYAAVGFNAALPTEETPYSSGILTATLICYLGLPILGWICNLIAMKFYPLTKEKMADIQAEIARIKTESDSAI